VRNRWLSGRAFVLHLLLITVVPACLLAGWWQVHRALSGNLLSYFYSVEWPIFAILGTSVSKPTSRTHAASVVPSFIETTKSRPHPWSGTRRWRAPNSGLTTSTCGFSQTAAGARLGVTLGASLRTLWGPWMIWPGQRGRTQAGPVGPPGGPAAGAERRQGRVAKR
jgi:hypothetical protein